MSYNAIVFDLDGTLLDTLDDLANAMNRVLYANGFPAHEVDAYRYFIGSGALKHVTRALPEDSRDEETIEKCLQAFRADYIDSWHVKTKPYDGVTELFGELANRSIRMSVLSNKPDEFTKACVEHYFAKWEFAAVTGPREGILPKPDLSGVRETMRALGVPADQTLYLGDTGVDMDTARGAGLKAIGALWGFRTEAELLEHGAEVLIRHPLGLLELLDG